MKIMNFVCLDSSHKLTVFNPSTSYEYIVTLETSDFILDILKSMGSSKSITDQLDLDLPRDDTYINGVKIISSTQLNTILDGIKKDIIAALLTQAFYAPIYEIILRIFINHHVVQTGDKRKINLTWTKDYVRLEQSKNFIIYNNSLEPRYSIKTFCEIEPFDQTYFTLFISVNDIDYEIV